MKRNFSFLLFCLILLCSCNNYHTGLFKISNESDWDIIISLNNFNELGKKQTNSNYMINKHSSEFFYLYNDGNCELISVNGAKIIKKTNSELILKNDTPKKIKVVNSTKKNIKLSNMPSLPCPLNRQYANTRQYVPLFSPVIIEKFHNFEISAKEINIYAWQLEFCKNDDELNTLSIGINTNNNFKYKFKKINNDIYLFLF